MTTTVRPDDTQSSDKSDAKPDYRSTLNITLNDKDAGAFPQRGNLPAREPEFQARWNALDIYNKSVRRDAPRGSFILHDGPPYSNGNIHLGTALNKIAKDVITRFRTMQGFHAPYVPGWDNHGMPIENAVAKKFRENKQVVSRVELRQACRDYAAQWVDTQREQFKRLGVRGDWNDPYLTMSKDFEATIVRVFGELALKGFIYRGLKPVFWCATCETALADAEVEYEPHTSNSIYVRFPMFHDPQGVFAGLAGEDVCRAYAIIWTTTPWTIPANLAIAAHPTAEYAVVRAKKRYGIDTALAQKSAGLLHKGIDWESDKDLDIIEEVMAAEDDEPEAGLETAYYLVAVPLVESVMAAAGVTDYQIVRTIEGAGLQGLIFRHPLFHRTSPVLLADYVTMDAGTGLVHTAPGHGKEDFETGLRYGLEVLTPVDAAGRYTPAAGEYDGRSFEGLRVTTWGDKKGQDAEANPVMLDALRASGNLLNASKFEHSYPHCWRCHSPLIFRATVQWFMNIDHEVQEGEKERGGEGETNASDTLLPFRREALNAIEEVTWYPRESVNRITSMVANRPDWCVSRQRSWGVGIPAFYCEQCGEHVLTEDSIGAVVRLVEQEGSDAWYIRSASEILPADFHCPHCQSGVDRLRKETDVLDVWFDSGSTNRAVLENHAHWPDLSWPADVYLEGGDQHRGWFNSSLMIGVGTRDRAPFKSVITNGWALDEKGEAQHKSKGNVIDPIAICNESGADVVRWWVASQNFMEDVRCGPNLLKQVGEMYRRVRNTFRFLLNNLYDFDPAVNAVPVADMPELDQWALAQLGLLVENATAAYEVYEFQRVYQMTLNFCSTELSSFYMDVVKDRLYADGANSASRRSVQTVMHTVADTLARLLAPILAHTSEEVWDYLKTPGKAESVHLASFPTSENVDTALVARWEPILALREAVMKKLEPARQTGVIGKFMEAHVSITLSPERYALLSAYEEMMKTLFIVSDVSLSEGQSDQQDDIEIEPAEGEKCARCWLDKRDVGSVDEYPDVCERCANVIKGLAAA